MSTNLPIAVVARCWLKMEKSQSAGDAIIVLWLTGAYGRFEQEDSRNPLERMIQDILKCSEET